MGQLEFCGICGCELHRTKGTYARATTHGRSHATKHHFVAERFFGRSGNRPGTKVEGIFNTCPWDSEGQSVVLCYECHEELIHNPVFLPHDIQLFAKLVSERGFSEDAKPENRAKIAGRIRLLHEVFELGLASMLVRNLTPGDDASS